MRFPRRRTLWLGAALLLAIAIVAWFVVPPNRITQANYDRIHEGMTVEEAAAILGATDEFGYIPDGGSRQVGYWGDGPRGIRVYFLDRRVFRKDLCLPTTWEFLQWYAIKGAEKIGVKWD
ncbi:MAG TPA: hypothetical protein VGY66_19825 [Gemmataceae bacterium]|jgi:hypothetical protein|nr:hypothetical protein [Gemmataceae bacterium]